MVTDRNYISVQVIVIEQLTLRLSHVIFVIIHLMKDMVSYSRGFTRYVYICLLIVFAGTVYLGVIF